MSEPLSPAEEAVATELRAQWCAAHFVKPELVRLDSWTASARSVVAAARPLIEAEALDDMADRFEAFGTLVGEQAWPFVTELRTSARSRRSALEGEQDHA
jgi:hypothetical protein